MQADRANMIITTVLLILSMLTLPIFLLFCWNVYSRKRQEVKRLREDLRTTQVLAGAYNPAAYAMFQPPGSSHGTRDAATGYVQPYAAPEPPGPYRMYNPLYPPNTGDVMNKTYPPTFLEYPVNSRQGCRPPQLVESNVEVATAAALYPETIYGNPYPTAAPAAPRYPPPVYLNYPPAPGSLECERQGGTRVYEPKPYGPTTAIRHVMQQPPTMGSGVPSPTASNSTAATGSGTILVGAGNNAQHPGYALGTEEEHQQPQAQSQPQWVGGQDSGPQAAAV